MFLKYTKYSLYFLIISFFMFSKSYSEIVKSIILNGNERVSKETILMFADVKIGDNLTSVKINNILKNIYDSQFFNNVSVDLNKNILSINVVEYPIIQNIAYEGIKANKIKDVVFKDLKLKPRSSYNEILLKDDLKKIKNSLKDLGYYFSEVNISIIQQDDNKIDLLYDVELGKKSKIKKITFIGNKVFKDRKLKRLITSEEYKFWKFISGKKYLNESLINFDERLLKNFYLNKGYYNIKVNSSFAKLINDDEFELIFNINANKKFFFNNIEIKLPADFNRENFKNLYTLFEDLKGKNYSIKSVEKIIEEIDKVTLLEQFETISATVDENLDGNKINLLFNIEKKERLVLEKINIFGNNITRENVIRNQFEIDEGDPFNEILTNKTINNIKSLRFFKTVESKIEEGTAPNNRILNISVEEKATGEISAGAGFSSNGASVMFGVRENNYLGKGIKVDSNLLINEESIKGTFSVTNPNFNNSDKSVNMSIQSSETNRLTDFGYKTNKSGFTLGTYFEYLDDMNLGLATSNYYEKIETDSTASARQKSQEGSYWDSFINLNFDYDKRNQKFETSDGFRSRYLIDLPIISKTNSLTNTFNYQYYTELYENNISNFSIYLKAVDSISNDDVKLSERIFLPSNKIRGFERGKIGPKDGDDFIGGNYATALNFSTSLPQLLENSQNVDFIAFIDVANIWGVDYNSSLDVNDEIRSSIGLGIDWFSPIGPMNFTFAETITKADTDITESFRFNLGTTF